MRKAIEMEQNDDDKVSKPGVLLKQPEKICFPFGYGFKLKTVVNCC